MNRPSIALVATAYGPGSAGQIVGDRFFVGYPRAGRWHQPAIRVTALHVVDQGTEDLGAAKVARFGCQAYPTVAAALRLGGEQLAVDGVILLGDGDDLHDDLYRQCVDVFTKGGRGVPVYSGPRPGASFASAQQAAAAARRLDFPLLSGSALPLGVRLPDLDLPPSAEVSEGLVVSPGGWDAAGYQALEAMLAIIERRRGGESGVTAVQMLEGPSVWLAGSAGRWSKTLLASALSRSDSPQGLTITDGRTQDLMGSGEVRKLAKSPGACLIDHADGMRSAVLMLEGAVKDFTFAARVGGSDSLSTQFFVSPAPNHTQFACLAAKIEEFFTSKKTPYPIERCLLACGIREGALASRAKNHARLATPHLKVPYQPPPASQHCRN